MADSDGALDECLYRLSCSVMLTGVSEWTYVIDEAELLSVSRICVAVVGSVTEHVKYKFWLPWYKNECVASFDV